MAAIHLDRLWEELAGASPAVAVLWLGLAALTVALVVLMWTRWGQYRPLRKCLVLSLFAHFLLAFYLTTVRVVFSGPGLSDETRIALVDGAEAKEGEVRPAEKEEKPWEELRHDQVAQPEREELPREMVEPLPDAPREVAPPQPLPDRPAVDHQAPQTPAPAPEPPLPPPDAPPNQRQPAKEAEPIEAPAAQRREAPRTPVRPVADFVRPSTEQPPMLDRTPAAGLPAGLLMPPAPLPRLAESPVAADPADMISNLNEQFSAATRGNPAAAPGANQAAANPTAAPSAASAASVRIESQPLAMARPMLPGLDIGALAAVEAGLIGPPQMPALERYTGGDPSVPSAYRLRTAPDRAQLAQQQGATPDTENAVKAALKWLAANQAADGRWDASDHGSGREDMALGRNRQNAGVEADTGVTGLALLAFLASGHTHLAGDYRDTVRRGLEYLLRAQARDGNLGAAADSFARMYCHAMATLALSEALGMSGDERLREPVRRALAYTVACQSTTTGGWRYVPADPGDTSQLGWQWMALKSGELAGIPIPERTRQGTGKFLRSVSSGRAGGLAAYRPGEPPSRSMTAEALFCWELLGLERNHPAVAEAADYIAAELPGAGKANEYYWYYATLALYQLQGEPWRRWNAALQKTLIERQQKTGPLAGSWDTDTVWGGYGGRIYTTALAALTLEVYYRYLPLYTQGRPERAM